MKQLILLTIIFCGSCATTSQTSKGARFDIEIDSYGDDSSITKKNCFIYVADSTINQSDLQFIEFRKYIEKSLTIKGYSIKDSIEHADIIILMNYGISDPKSFTYQRSVPVWGQTGIQKSTTTGTIQSNPYSNSATYSQQTTNQPSYGVTGYKATTSTYTLFYRYINLVAFDFEYFLNNNTSKRIWQTQITSSGSSDDLRRVFPIMIVGALPWFGKSTGTKITQRLHENDPKVLEFKMK